MYNWIKIKKFNTLTFYVTKVKKKKNTKTISDKNSQKNILLHYTKIRLVKDDLTNLTHIRITNGNFILCINIYNITIKLQSLYHYLLKIKLICYLTNRLFVYENTFLLNLVITRQ